MDKLKTLTEDQTRTDFPAFKSGDHVRVHVKVIEGEKERIQPF